MTLLSTDDGRLGFTDLGRVPDPLGAGHVCEPRLAVLADGTALLAYRSGSARISRDGRVGLLRSDDGGHSWEWLGTPFPMQWDGRDGEQLLAVLAPTGPRSLVAWLGWMDRRDERPWRNRTTDGRLPLRILQAESTDAGETWESLHEVHLGPVEQAVPQCMLALTDGSLVATFETFKHYDDPGPWRYQAGAVRSTDGGVTWSAPVAAAAADASGRMWWDPRCAELLDGRLVQYYHAFDYPIGSDGDVHVAWSEDGGRSWSPPWSTGVAGQVSWPVVLGSGRLVVLQQRRHAPPGIVALPAREGGRSVDADNTIEIYGHRTATVGAADGSRSAVEYFDDMDGFTFGHPTGARLADGAALIAYYAGARGRTDLYLSRLTDPGGAA